MFHACFRAWFFSFRITRISWPNKICWAWPRYWCSCLCLALFRTLSQHQCFHQYLMILNQQHTWNQDPSWAKGRVFCLTGAGHWCLSYIVLFWVKLGVEQSSSSTRKSEELNQGGKSFYLRFKGGNQSKPSKARCLLSAFSKSCFRAMICWVCWAKTWPAKLGLPLLYLFLLSSPYEKTYSHSLFKYTMLLARFISQSRSVEGRYKERG